MAYQAAPYSDLDYLTAILMGESGPRDDARAMGALADVVMNRVNGTQSPRTAYGDSFSYNPGTVAGQVTATYRGAPQFSSADRAQAQREGTGAAYDNYNNALTRGADAFSGAARDRYNQARAVASSFLDQNDPNYGRYSGVSGGSDFFVARGYPTYLRGGRYDSQTIGGSDFFKLKSNGGFTPWNDPGDRGVMSALPPAGSDLTGDGFDASQGGGSVGPGGFGLGTGVVETGNPFGFTGADASYGIGPGFNNLGGATPFGDVSRFAFGSGYNVGGGDAGSFNSFLPPLEAGGTPTFTGLNPGDALGVGNGAFGSGIVQPGPAPDPYGFSASNFGGGVSPGMAGELPAGFDPAAYLAQNRDVASSGMDAATHWRNFGAAEGRALAPPGWTQTQGPPAVTPTFGPSGTPTIGSGSPASTIGAPAASGSLPPFFSPVDYLAANGDLQALGFTPERAAQHFQEFGRHEVRALAPWLQASVYDAPGATATQGPGGLSPTYQPPQPTQTFGPGGSVDVMSSGLVPTQGPPDLTPTQGPGPTITARTGTFNPDEYLRANTDVAASGQSALDHFLNYGAREGRAIDTLGNHFNGQAYLAANGDVAMAGLDPLAHFLRYGAQEARTLAPTDWASTLGATTEVTPQGASWLASTYGPGQTANTYGAPGLTPTYAAPDPVQTIGPPALTGTYGPPATTPTIGAGSSVPTLGPGFTQPSWSPGGGISNPFGFSGSNVGSALGATPQTFASAYPLDTNIGYSSGGSPGGGGISDFGFSGADVSGFDVNAASPPMEGGSQGGGGGGGGGGGTAKGSSSSAAFLADQARTRAYWDTLAKPANLYGYTSTSTPPIVAAPVVPNLTLTNLNAANAGMGGAMLGSGLNLSINSRPLAGGFGFGF